MESPQSKRSALLWLAGSISSSLFLLVGAILLLRWFLNDFDVLDKKGSEIFADCECQMPDNAVYSLTFKHYLDSGAIVYEGNVSHVEIDQFIAHCADVSERFSSDELLVYKIRECSRYISFNYIDNEMVQIAIF